MKIAVKNLSGLAGLLLFAAATLATAHAHDRKTLTWAHHDHHG
jgi:hypothetical protein